MVEMQEKVLPVGHGAYEDASVQQRRAVGEPALRTGNREALAGEHVRELARQAVNGMPLRH
jgi:hypothetical protein